jgi:CheY-like chemotaxis protein
MVIGWITRPTVPVGLALAQKEHRFDVVLLDLHLPRLDGLDVSRQPARDVGPPPADPDADGPRYARTTRLQASTPAPTIT